MSIRINGEEEEKVSDAEEDSALRDALDNEKNWYEEQIKKHTLVKRQSNILMFKLFGLY